jgi:phosphodiesterase/alkaline phosphatase D-like protein
MSDPNRSAPPSSRPAPDAIDRREFLRLGLGTAVLLGCGDDPAGASDGSTGSTTTTDASSSSTGDPTTTATPTTTSETTGDPTTTGDSTTTTTTGDSTTTDPTTTEDPTTGDATTGEPAVCAGQPIAFDPAAIALDAALFPTAVMAGEMRPTSVMLAFFIAEPGPRTLRVWRSSEVPGEVNLIHETQVEPGVDGFLKVTVDELCPGTWYSYGLFVGEPDAFTARSLLGEFRTAIADDALEPLTLALASCNGSSLVWPSMTVTADEYYDMFIHLGDMAYNDGATSLAEFRASWRKYLGAEGYKLAFSRAGLYATWDDHEIDNNSNFDRETMDPQQLAKRQNAFDTFFEALPIDAEGPDYQLWRSFRWGLTAEIIVLDCRYERRPSMQQYISPAQMAFLKERLLTSPCHFKVIMNSVPITNMPGVWDFAADDRWEGYAAQRNEVLDHIDQHDIKNVWFLSGDFHVCFVSRLEPAGQKLSARTREIAVTSGNTNPLPEFLSQLDPPQFSYGVHQPRAVLLTFDPQADNVHVRFLDPQTGEELHAETLTQN